jgi:hypothetical protein
MVMLGDGIGPHDEGGLESSRTPQGVQLYEPAEYGVPSLGGLVHHPQFIYYN